MWVEWRGRIIIIRRNDFCLNIPLVKSAQTFMLWQTTINYPIAICSLSADHKTITLAVFFIRIVKNEISIESI